MHNMKHDVLVTLTHKINGLPPPLHSSEYSIFRVHNHLREVNKKAYEPELVSIGPYHRGKPNLQMMEDHKLRYFYHIVNGNSDFLAKSVSAMRLLEEDARKCYAGPVGLDTDQFVEMLVLDSCFVVELMIKYDKMGSPQKQDDVIFKMHWMITSLRRDLMLFENQLPFFVIQKMFDLIYKNRNDEINNGVVVDLKYFVRRFFFDFLMNKSYAPQGVRESDSRILHLLHLMREDALPMREDALTVREDALPMPEDTLPMREDALSSSQREERSHNAADEKEFLYMPCASKLVESGVKFKKIETGKLFDITFKDGVLSIPKIRIEDRTESVFRNLIAFEQYSDPTSCKIVTDYAAFMDLLIDTPKDVGILSSKGIVDNWLGEDDAISNMFNKIVLLTVSSDHFHYANVCAEVKKYCDRRMNRWMAKLKSNYFHSPWGIISVVAATILLLLTLTQTVATIVFR